VSEPIVAGIAALILTLLVHTGALFYWGGTVKQMLRDHDKRIENLERRAYPRREDSRQHQ